MVKWILPNGKVARVAAILWALACISLHVHPLLLENGPTRAYGDAVVAECFTMLALSFPSSMIVYCPWLNFAISGSHHIFAFWLLLFVLGYFQWFCLLRTIQKVYDLSPPLIAWIRRKCGIKDEGSISCIPKE